MFKNKWIYPWFLFGILFLAAGGYLMAWGDQIPWPENPQQYLVYALLMLGLGIVQVLTWLTLSWGEMKLSSYDKAPAFFVWTVAPAGVLVLAGAFARVFTANLQLHGLSVIVMGISLMLACAIWRIRMAWWQPEPAIAQARACDNRR